MIESAGVGDAIRALAQALCAFVIITTVLPVALPRAKAWWIRIFDFPRVQLAVIGIVGCGVSLAVEGAFDWPLVVLPGLAAVAVVYQAVRIWRYTPLAPREVQRSRSTDPSTRVSLVLSNVLEDNRDAPAVLRAIRDANPTMVLCVETDEWWREQLDPLADSHPYAVRCPLPNTYGMLFYSRLPIEDTSVDFLIQDDVPSIQAMVRLESGERVWVNCLHPRPPAPGESDSSAERDAELVVVAKRVQHAATPVIVCGDLNDVAWSRTTRLFQKLSRLVDPRKGRGFFGTFHARYPFLRYPLDHVFHSDDFRLVQMRLLPYVGSDHFPVYVELSLEPDAARKQEAPEKDGEDEAEGAETVIQAREREDGRSGS
jgi:endonuclease/exonuclease/phosphatase (EEP) superfamily protein YafD